RLGLSDHDDPVKVERDLMALFPPTQWLSLTYLLIEHGRAICVARRPLCEECVVARWCPAARLPERPVLGGAKKQVRAGKEAGRSPANQVKG
ncbi:MAG: endonuclease III domain-containing protein, partial [Actinomycetota bacterium]